LQENIPAPGIVGPKASVRCFVEYWKTRTGKDASLKTGYRLYACEQVLTQPYSRGHLRSAANDDESLAVRWAAEFCRSRSQATRIEAEAAAF